MVVRVVAALAATVLIAFAAMLVLFVGLGPALEDKCPQMAPPGATGSGGPYWVGPTTFRCVYVGAPERVKWMLPVSSSGFVGDGGLVDPGVLG
jgi:hypothetical protein